MRMNLAHTVMLLGLASTAACAPTDQLGEATSALVGFCGEASCVPPEGSYISHFSGADCTGTEAYYTPYFSGGYTGISGRCWPHGGDASCGTVLRTLTNISYRYQGVCYGNAWPSGNTLDGFVLVYRDPIEPILLTVVRDGAGAGSVRSDVPSIDCGASCIASFDAGAEVTLTASAARGSIFAGWTGGGCSGTRSCTVTLSQSLTVTATFSPKPTKGNRR